jgi:7-cyano-7-deazaguanine synthase
MTARAFILLSGGIDSSTCLFLAGREYTDVTGISVFYGQRHVRELEAAKTVCRLQKVKHHILDLSAVVPKTMLTDTSREVPNVSYEEIEGVSPTYVPFRNGLLLSAAASWIMGEHNRSSADFDLHVAGAEWALYFGAHAEDAHAWAYPDCTPEFIGAMANAIYMGTYQQLRLHTPLEWLTKADIIQLGDRLGVPWDQTWSCYAGGQLHCGTCPTCQARRQGFVRAGVYDPTMYSAAPAATL